MEKMRANVFHGVGDIRIEEVERPRAGVGEAVIRITLTTICGTDLHILRGEYPVERGLIIGHEPVGVIEELGAGVTGYEVGDRVLVGAITPCGGCRACLSGQWSQCGGGRGAGYEAVGGWRFGNTINGAQAEYLLVPNAQANLAIIPDELTDEQVILLSDIASTGFSGAESGNVKIGDSVVVFAQGPIGLCASIGAKLLGASLVIGVDGDDARLAMARKMGVDIVLDYRATDVVAEVKEKTKLRIYPLHPKVLALGGVILMGIGLYFIFLRPPLLPEDARYMDTSLVEIQATAPGLSRWLQKVFWVMGGYIFTAGLLTIYIAFSTFQSRTWGAFPVVALAGLSSIGWMSVVNFIIESDFKWILLMSALPWAVALILYRIEK